MTVKRMLALCAVLVVLCLTIGMMPDEVYAQSDSNAAKADDDNKDSLTPSKAQMAVGVGSFIVMIIVVKWL